MPLVQLAWLPAAGQVVEAEYWVGKEERWAKARERGGRKRYYESLTDSTVATPRSAGPRAGAARWK